MPRIQLPTPDDEPEAFALLRAKRGHAPNAQIFRTLATCPEILEVFIPMADAVRNGCGIDRNCVRWPSLWRARPWAPITNTIRIGIEPSRKAC